MVQNAHLLLPVKSQFVQFCLMNTSLAEPAVAKCTSCNVASSLDFSNILNVNIQQKQKPFCTFETNFNEKQIKLLYESQQVSDALHKVNFIFHIFCLIAVLVL